MGGRQAKLRYLRVLLLSALLVAAGLAWSSVFLAAQKLSRTSDFFESDLVRAWKPPPAASRPSAITWPQTLPYTTLIPMDRRQAAERDENLRKWKDDPAAHVKAGNAYADAKQYPDAINEYLIADSLKPNDAKILYALAYAYFCGGWYDNAIKAFNDVIKVEPKSADAHYGLGSAYYYLKRNSQAVAETKIAFRLKPSLVLGSLDVAPYFSDLFTAAVKASPKDVDARFALALCSESLGGYEDAAKEYGEVLRLKPDDGDAAYRLGRTCFQLKRYSEAVDALKTAIRVNPTNADAHRFSAFAYDKLARYDDAEREYQEAAKGRVARYEDRVRQSPNSHFDHYMLGTTYTDAGRFADAVREIQEAIRLKPEFHFYHRGLGMTYYCLGRYQDAANEFEAADEDDRLDADTLYGLGLSYLQLGREQEASEQFRKAVYLRHEQRWVWYSPDTARIIVKTLGAPGVLKSDEALRHYVLANGYSKLQRYDDAVGEYRVVIHRSPADADAHFDLGVALGELGDFAGMSWECGEYVRLSNLPATARAIAGSEYYELGRYEDAERELKEAVRLNFLDDWAHLDLAQTYLKLGDMQGERGERSVLAVQDKTALRLLDMEENPQSYPAGGS